MEWFVIRQLFTWDQTTYMLANEGHSKAFTKMVNQVSIYMTSVFLLFRCFPRSLVPTFVSLVCLFFYFILVDLYDSEFCVPLISVEIFHIFVKGPAEAGYGIFSRLVKVLMGLFSALCSGSLWWHIHTTDRQYCAWFALNFNISLK